MGMDGHHCHQPARGASVGGIVLNIRDVTERLRADEAGRGREQRSWVASRVRR